jgi:hypothetical protein
VVNGVFPESVHIYGHGATPVIFFEIAINFLLPTPETTLGRLKNGPIAVLDEKHYYSRPHLPP